jgi:hypothetical protein
MKNNLIVFVVVNLVCGIGTFLGSTFGHAFSQAGVFIGAIIGGITGILLCILWFVKRKLIDASQLLSTTIWGLLFFGMAALFAATNLNTPLIPLLSLSFAGLGCVAGRTYKLSKGQYKHFYFALSGFLMMLPTLYFVTGSLVKYSLGFSHSFTLLDVLEHMPAATHYFNLISPFIFLGGTLLCIAMNAPVRFVTEKGKLFPLQYGAGGHKLNLIMALVGCLLVLTLMIYILLENLTSN